MTGFRLGAYLDVDIGRESIVFGVWTLMQEPRCRLALYWDLVARLCFAEGQALECIVLSRRLVCRVALGDVPLLGVLCWSLVLRDR